MLNSGVCNNNLEFVYENLKINILYLGKFYYLILFLRRGFSFICTFHYKFKLEMFGHIQLNNNYVVIIYLLIMFHEVPPKKIKNKLEEKPFFLLSLFFFLNKIDCFLEFFQNPVFLFLEDSYIFDLNVPLQLEFANEKNSVCSFFGLFENRKFC